LGGDLHGSVETWKCSSIHLMGSGSRVLWRGGGSVGPVANPDEHECQRLKAARRSIVATT
jgi:hypothetical protein